MRDLSVLIPARNEMFLARTIEDILENIEADTEVIAVCDGAWADPPINDHPRVQLIYHPVSIGQRAATNEAARVSTARYVMKADAHCAFDKGFDRKLIADCKPDWTMVPMMYNLHAFDWQCQGCGVRTYQGPEPAKCLKCNHAGHERVIVWKPRPERKTVSWRFDNKLHFQYWHEHAKRPEIRKAKIIPTMSLIGACWMMSRERYWFLEGMDEAHGSWGQMGTEIACKSWLSGGALMTSKRTWFAHMFRTNNAGFSFPYPISGKDVGRARKHSRNLWEKNAWPKQIHPLEWLVEQFKPVPGWHDIEPTEGKNDAAVASV